MELYDLVYKGSVYAFDYFKEPLFSLSWFELLIELLSKKSKIDDTQENILNQR